MTEVTTIPDNAMRVETDHEGENYVRFAAVDVIEWFTDHSDGEKITRERFVAPDPAYPEDVAEILDEQ